MRLWQDERPTWSLEGLGPALPSPEGTPLAAHCFLGPCSGQGRVHPSHGRGQAPHTHTPLPPTCSSVSRRPSLRVTADAGVRSSASRVLLYRVRAVQLTGSPAERGPGWCLRSSRRLLLTSQKYLGCSVDAKDL